MQKSEKLKDEKIEDICRVCKQPLNNEARQAAEAEKQQRVDQFKEEYAAVVEKRQKQQDLKKYAHIGLSVQLDQLREF
ncbi:hypothetical protein P7H22_26060 [Paenibacillus larvae]|nr:hypothetical protein [Paenibacillus larvae]MDT2243098.1 hypothetical protein [Paenibacillus larvae]